jgi:hypothetical protein
VLPQSDCPDRGPDWATFSPAFCGSSSSIFCGHGDAFFRASVPAAKALSGAYEEGIAHAHHHQSLALGIGADALGEL